MYSKVVEEIPHAKRDHEETEDLDQSYNEDDSHQNHIPIQLHNPQLEAQAAIIAKMNFEKQQKISQRRTEALEQMRNLINLKRRPPRSFGNTFVLMYFKDRALLTVGPDFASPLCLLLIESVILCGVLTLLYFTFPLAFCIGLLVVIFQISSLICLIILNPGHPSFKIKQEHFKIVDQDPNKWCLKCKVIRIKDISHCYECDTCVLGHDHHCAFFGKCIGRWNIVFFYAFISGTCILLAFMFFSVFGVLMTLNDSK